MRETPVCPNGNFGAPKGMLLGLIRECRGSLMRWRKLFAFDTCRGPPWVAPCGLDALAWIAVGYLISPEGENIAQYRCLGNLGALLKFRGLGSGE